MKIYVKDIVSRRSPLPMLNVSLCGGPCHLPSRSPFNAYARTRAAADAADLQARELRAASREREHAAREALLDAREEELRQAVALRSAEILDAHQQACWLSVLCLFLNDI